MATWNRHIAKGNGYLDCTKSAANADPPPAPGHGARTDTANDITTYPADRPVGGAKILYHSTDVVLTKITMKEGSLPEALSYEANSPGTLLTVTDKGATGTDYSYYVEGDGKQTQDPQIHNVG